MFRKQNLLLIIIIALISVGCGTDGINENPNALRISPSTKGGVPDFVFSGNSYSYILDVKNGTATDVNLNKFTQGGQFLQASIVNGGSQIELSGTVPTIKKGTRKDFDFELTAISADQSKNAEFTFSITVNN